MTALLATLVAFLGISLLFYVLFAGADFGAGIVELFLNKNATEQRALISRAIAPVWEANHVWLILAIVIVFMGFPSVYALISIHLHLPVIAVLVGITARGCAFTFRHYDTFDATYHRIYSRVFAWSSLWTAFFLGTVAGALLLGRFDAAAPTYAAAYLAPWLNPFCAAVGMFAVALFACLAAVYLVGEAQTAELRQAFARMSLQCAGFMLVAGLLVFLAAAQQELPLLQAFLANPLSLAAIGLATLFLLPFWQFAIQQRPLPLRVCGAALVSLVLFGWFAVGFPLIIGLQHGVSLVDAAAPPATLLALLHALIVGCVLIFPALAYLFWVFKRQRPEVGA